jgi:transposase
VPQDHPLHLVRAMTDEALRNLQPRFKKLYAKTGRPSIAAEKLLRALLLQALYSVRCERMLMEQLDYNVLFPRFVGLKMDDAIWDVTVFTKNRERLLGGDIAEAFFQACYSRRASEVRSRTSTSRWMERYWSAFGRTVVFPQPARPLEPLLAFPENRCCSRFYPLDRIDRLSKMA